VRGCHTKNLMKPLVRKLALSLALAASITLFGVQITHYAPVQSANRTETYQVRGYPFSWWVHNASFSPNPILPDISPSSHYRIHPYLLNFLFWMVCSLALLTIIGSKKRALTFFFCALFALLLLISFGKGPESAWPVSLSPSVISLNQPVWLYQGLNYIFWLVISLPAVGTILAASRSSNPWMLRLIAPAVLTVISIIYAFQCTGLFCLIPSGRGFPLPFLFFGPSVQAIPFLIDYLFWMLIFNLALLFTGFGKNTYRLKRGPGILKL
jgi:hypothetical protein